MYSHCFFPSSTSTQFSSNSIEKENIILTHISGQKWFRNEHIIIYFIRQYIHSYKVVCNKLVAVRLVVKRKRKSSIEYTDITEQRWRKGTYGGGWYKIFRLAKWFWSSLSLRHKRTKFLIALDSLCVLFHSAKLFIYFFYGGRSTSITHLNLCMCIKPFEKSNNV